MKLFSLTLCKSFIPFYFLLAGCAPTLIGGALSDQQNITQKKHEKRMREFDDQTEKTMRDLDLGMESIMTTCGKKENQLSIPDLRTKLNSISQEKFDLKLSVEKQDVDVYSCDRKRHLFRRQESVVDSHQNIIIPPPANLKAEVNFVEISSERTCSHLRASVNKNLQLDPTKQKEKKSESEKSAEELTALISTMVDSKGFVNVSATSAFRRTWWASLNVDEGLDIVSVLYYGPCLEYRKERDLKKDDSTECLRAELLGAKTVVLDTKFDKKVRPGVGERRSCWR